VLDRDAGQDIEYLPFFNYVNESKTSRDKLKNITKKGSQNIIYIYLFLNIKFGLETI
jgi:hypothetical protein